MSDSRLGYAQALLGEAREELGRADAKVAVLLATVGVGTSVVAGAIVAGRWSPAHLASWAQAIWWVGAALAFAGIAVLASALAPRVRHSEDKFALRYFGHAAQFSSPRELLDIVGDVSGQMVERAVDQLWVISRVVILKYARIHLSLIAFAAAGALMIVAAGAG